MQVAIAYEVDAGFYISDPRGVPVVAIWFGDYVAAEDYAIEHGYVLLEMED